MKTNMLILKHQMHSARDLCINFDVDVEAKAITLKMEWIDTQLLKWWLQIHQLSAINNHLKHQNQSDVESLKGFKVKLIVDEKATFDVSLFKSEINHEHDTLVMKLRD